MEQTENKSLTILDAFFLFEALQSQQHIKNIRINKWEVPYYREVVLYDYCLDNTGDQEDRLYLKKPFYYDNIRRGNTIIQILDKISNHPKTTFFGRKGLRKFFFLKEEYINFNLKHLSNDEFTEKVDNRSSFFNPSEHFKLNRMIFQSIRDAFDSNSEIEVFKLLKANGENCQIAWIESVQSWIIASKNVSILARSESDIDLYLKDRFNYAKMIARTWFNILKRIEIKGADIVSLKAFLKKHTFVGEYVGNPECQHIIHYYEIDIVFYAIINNQIDQECLAPLDAFKIFSQYFLNTVRMEDIGIFKSFEDLNQALKILYSQISCADLELEQEGSVIYFVCTKSNKVLSLCKIKTLEYAIFRILREKLRYFIKYYDNLKFEPFQSFYNEVEELCATHKPPRPLDFYYKISQFAIDFICENLTEASIIHKKFVTFLYCVTHAISSDIVLTPQIIKEVVPLSAWPQYNMEAILKYHFKNSLKTHKKGEHEFSNNLSNNSHSTITINKKKLFLVIPIMLPGNGKSFLIPYLHEALIVGEKSFSFEAISADKIRRECMNNLAQRQPSCKEEKLFEQTGKIANITLTKNMEFQIRNIRNSNKEYNFLFIDKNHTPNAFEKVVENARKMCPDGVELSITALCPECENNNLIKTENGHIYPFSWNYFFTCFYRVQNRVEHETLVNRGEKSANVMIMYLQLFRDISLSEKSLKEKGFDQVVKIDLTEEKKVEDFNENLANLLGKILDNTEIKKKCENIDLIFDFLKLFEKTLPFFPQLSKSYLLEASKKIIKNMINQHLNKDNDFISISDKKMPIQENQNYKKENNDTLEPPPRKIIKIERKNYSPKIIPNNLSVFAVDNDDCKPKILNFIRANLTFLKTEFPQDEIISENLASLTKDFFLPRRFESMIMEINGDLSKTETHAFRNFQEGLRTKLMFFLLFYIPNRLLAGLFICNNELSSMMECEFPFMTFMMFGNSPSEFVAKALNEFFYSDKILLEKYKKNELFKEKSCCFKIRISTEKKKTDAYLSKIEKGIEIDAETVAYIGK